MRLYSKYPLLLIVFNIAPIYCHNFDLKYNYASLDVEHDQRRIFKINKEYVLRNAHSGVEVHPGFNIILTCVLDLLVHWGRENVTLLTDDIHFGSGSSKTNIIGWFKSKGIAINLKTITTLHEKESIMVSTIFSEGRDFILICQSNLTFELLNMEFQSFAIFKNYIIIDSTLPTMFENLSSFHKTRSQVILVSPTYFGKIYEELIDSEINLFHIAYINYTNSWELIKFANWSSNKRLNLFADFDYYDFNVKLKHQSIRIATKSLSSCRSVHSNLNFKSLSKNLDFIVQCVTPEKPSFGMYLGNGTFDGAIGMLQTRDSDICSSALYAEANRWNAMRFVAPQTYTTMTIWYRQADATISPFAHVLAFNWSTWTAIMGALLVFTGVLAFAFIKINILWNRTFKRLRIWIFNGDMIIDILNEMPGPSNKILSGVLYLWVLLLFAHYNSVLKSFLINKHQEILFTSLEDIVQRKDYRVLIKNGAFLHNYFMTSDENVHQNIFRRVKYHPDNLISNYEQVINFLCHEKAVFIELNNDADRVLGDGSTISLPCKLVKKPQVHFTVTAFLTLRKDFPYENLFKTKQLKLFEGGVFKRQFQGKLYRGKTATPENFALTLSHILTPISALTAGILCSMIALCIELCTYSRQQFKRN